MDKEMLKGIEEKAKKLWSETTAPPEYKQVKGWRGWMARLFIKGPIYQKRKDVSVAFFGGYNCRHTFKAKWPEEGRKDV